MTTFRLLFAALAMLCLVPAASATQHDQHSKDVKRHGDMAMGFSHLKTTHHFRLTTTGGSIEVSANDPKDTASRGQIRMHLQHIAKAF